MGMQVVTKGDDEECVNEVKRLGLMIDRKCPIQLRRGDTLVLYISRHHQE
jgi:hypothetical protein